MSDRETAYAQIIIEYADHGSWRCEHADRFPWDGPWPCGPGPGTSDKPDCACGLIGALRDAGIDPEPWMGPYLAASRGNDLA